MMCRGLHHQLLTPLALSNLQLLLQRNKENGEINVLLMKINKKQRIHPQKTHTLTHRY